MAKIKLLIVDDHQLIRDGLKKYIANDPDFELVGEAENGVQALEVLAKTKVDIILSDLNMPEMDGLELTEKVVMETKFGIFWI